MNDDKNVRHLLFRLANLWKGRREQTHQSWFVNGKNVSQGPQGPHHLLSPTSFCPPHDNNNRLIQLPFVITEYKHLKINGFIQRNYHRTIHKNNNNNTRSSNNNEKEEAKNNKREYRRILSSLSLSLSRGQWQLNIILKKKTSTIKNTTKNQVHLSISSVNGGRKCTWQINR